MGTWSHHPFGNDTALDWIYNLVETGDLLYIKSTLDGVLEQGSDYLEAPDAQEAIAAIEVIARLLGKGSPSGDDPEEVDAWVKSIKRKPGAALLQKAQKTLKRILSEDSELLELWQESDDFEVWKTTLENLRSTLSD